MQDLEHIVRSSFPGRRIAVVGDIVADQYLHGSISRVSREAPVFILRHDETLTLPGGAANAAANAARLGAEVTLAGFIGDDANGRLLADELGTASIDLRHSITVSRPTTTKVRVLASQPHAVRQQVIRIDYEDRSPVSDDDIKRLADAAASAVSEAEAVIFSDYGYGAACRRVFDAVKAEADRRDVQVIVDSRFRLEDLAGAASATPNREEAEAMLGRDHTDDDRVGLCRRLGMRSLLVTNGNQGMTLYAADGDMRHIDAVGPTEPVDVTGAGDTVIAAFALGIASGLTHYEAAMVANHAGGIVVMKKRTATVSADELCSSLEGGSPDREAAGSA